MALPRNQNMPVMPTPALTENANELLELIRADDRAEFALLDRKNGTEVELSEGLFEILRGIIVDLSQNRAISIVPMDAELTTVQAAEFLNVSRPYVIKLIETDKLQCRKVGTHRRIQLKELLDYKARSKGEREGALNELAKLGQEHGI